MRRKKWSGSRPTVGRTQREVLRDVMLTAAKYEAWLTLKELARFTRYGEASISAQLRHLRKARYGGFMIAKRQRAAAMRGVIDEPGVIWEYRMAAPVVVRRRKAGARTARTSGQPARARQRGAR
jgi:hypothetical protein